LNSPSEKKLTIIGAREHNLKNLTVEIPLERLLAITGVSGSGKSSLMFDIVDRAAEARGMGGSEYPVNYDRIDGWQYFQKVITVDQTPIGRLPRSNAATYTDLFTPIRQTFAQTEDAKRLQLSARHFSFNVPGGRCERCEGAGVLTVNMHFLPDVQVRCPACLGKRFQKEILSVLYQGVNISDVLEMTISDAREVFKRVPGILSRLDLLAEVGLGYLQLGQPATTLSGGESQRVKLAKELTRPAAEKVLYLLDEPTTGLHLADVEKLLALFSRLVQAGHSVIVVEHHLELIRSADWIIDLGPEGGASGGYLIGAGNSEDLMNNSASHTGQCLRETVII
jgi:excinuclease ABC subunit A